MNAAEKNLRHAIRLWLLDCVEKNGTYRKLDLHREFIDRVDLLFDIALKDNEKRQFLKNQDGFIKLA